MRGNHLAVVHLVDVVAREHEDVVGLGAAQHVQVLEHRVGRALVPLGLVDVLLRRHDLDELAEAAVEKAPAALDVADEALRLVLRGDADVADARIDAVGEGEIDDVELAAEGHGGLGAPVGQLLEPAAAAAGKHDGIGMAGELADETTRHRIPALADLTLADHVIPRSLLAAYMPLSRWRAVSPARHR